MIITISGISERFAAAFAFVAAFFGTGFAWGLCGAIGIWLAVGVLRMMLDRTAAGNTADAWCIVGFGMIGRRLMLRWWGRKNRRCDGAWWGDGSRRGDGLEGSCLDRWSGRCLDFRCGSGLFDSGFGGNLFGSLFGNFGCGFFRYFGGYFFSGFFGGSLFDCCFFCSFRRFSDLAFGREFEEIVGAVLAHSVNVWEKRVWWIFETTGERERWVGRPVI